MARLTVELNDALARVVDDLARTEGLARTHVVRRAIALLKFAADEKAGGRRLAVTDAEDRIVKQVPPVSPPRGEPPSPVPEPLSLEHLERALVPGAEVELPRIGRELALWVMVLIALTLALVFAYAALTFPDLESLKDLAAPDAVLEAYERIRTLWFQEVRGLLELLLPLFVTVLGAIIGYIFGRQTG
jgi:hypothetical protein